MKTFLRVVYNNNTDRYERKQEQGTAVKICEFHCFVFKLENEWAVVEQSTGWVVFKYGYTRREAIARAKWIFKNNLYTQLKEHLEKLPPIETLPEFNQYPESEAKIGGPVNDIP